MSNAHAYYHATQNYQKLEYEALSSVSKPHSPSDQMLTDTCQSAFQPRREDYRKAQEGRQSLEQARTPSSELSQGDKASAKPKKEQKPLSERQPYQCAFKSKKVHVRLPVGEISDAALKNLFLQFGKVREAYICTNPNKNGQKFGFVTFSTFAGSRNAAAREKLEHEGTEILITHVKYKREYDSKKRFCTPREAAAKRAARMRKAELRREQEAREEYQRQDHKTPLNSGEENRERNYAVKVVRSKTKNVAKKSEDRAITQILGLAAKVEESHRQAELSVQDCDGVGFNPGYRVILGAFNNDNCLRGMPRPRRCQCVCGARNAQYAQY